MITVFYFYKLSLYLYKNDLSIICPNYVGYTAEFADYSFVQNLSHYALSCHSQFFVDAFLLYAHCFYENI